MILQDEWLQLCSTESIQAQVADRWYTELAAAYSDPARCYHTLTHIQEVLQHIAELSSSPDTALLWAAWFHDVVYNTQSADNEKRSAEFAERAMVDMGIAKSVCDRTGRLILMTKHHKPELQDESACVLHDADLAILGAPPERYCQYALDIRNEYAWVTEEEYRKGRTRVLMEFLDRKTIFIAKEWQDRNKQARENIAAEIAQLSEQTPYHRCTE